ncbi:MAG: ribosome biogenesis GTPase YlqF [Pseudanabaenaceae cyanobacterium bins.68]|nr:ribosome biogenesis GTPase YlqF [Pseudanabaenaceae cyanobacterium bins.68]
MSIIQWYPGHIAKAEKALKEQLKLVDVVLEVRDARIPQASHHPKIHTWTEGRSHILVFNRMDMIPERVQQAWLDFYLQQQQRVYFTDAQSGKGIATLLKATQQAGIQLNQRRQNRGMLPRAVRAVVIGFPNVGKSALINRLLKKRVAASANRPGITRSLRWIRISDQIELLDTPGILPPLLEDQDSALKLAICDDIADAAYDSTLVAVALIEMLAAQGVSLAPRYGIEPQLGAGLEFLTNLSNRQNPQQRARDHDQVERVARQVLTDLRKGKLGQVALELPESYQRVLATAQIGF